MPKSVSQTAPVGPNQALHDEAVKLLVDLSGTKKKTKDYNLRRKEITAALQPILLQIKEVFEKGQTCGGKSTIKDWCKQVGGITDRRFRQIVSGESQTKPRKRAKVKIGLILEVDGRDLIVTQSIVNLLIDAFDAQQLPPADDVPDDEPEDVPEVTSAEETADEVTA
jgi:hypothetical protein